MGPFLNSTGHQSVLYDAWKMEERSWVRRARENRWAGGKGRLFLLLILTILPCCLNADTIYLKNGRKIEAQVTKEDAKQVFYERGGGEFALPRSIIDHIERSPIATSPPTTEGSRIPPAGHTDLVVRIPNSVNNR